MLELHRGALAHREKGGNIYFGRAVAQFKCTNPYGTLPFSMLRVADFKMKCPLNEIRAFSNRWACVFILTA